MKKVFIENLQMETQTVFMQNGNINIYPCAFELGQHIVAGGDSASQKGRTILVPDVDAFPSHIACSSLSRSEIVLPLRRLSDGTILGVLDIDSDHLAAFDDIDRQGLEAIVAAFLRNF